MSGCDVITRSGGSVRYDVMVWFRRFAAGIPSTPYGDVTKPVGVVWAETNGNDAVTMETKHMHQLMMIMMMITVVVVVLVVVQM